jgi:arylsulfatase A-like enzyme
MVAALAIATGPVPATYAEDAPKRTNQPNIVVILVDDMGYGDIGPFGSKKNRTPELDRLADDGMKLTSFYAAPLCSASRAQLLTGCYAQRVSIPSVFVTGDQNGIASTEHTVAELLRKQGYATMCIGKWHLGDQPPFLPTKHGFDEYFGLPYSNDMEWDSKERGVPVVPLMRGEQVIKLVTDEEQEELTERYTDEAVRFITDNRSRPFFLYLAHTAVHVPIHPGHRFQGHSENGRYGDWVEEVDWSTGKVIETLRSLHLDGNTLVVFTSDNGPWLEKGRDAGSAGPLRGGKNGTFEGGLREPTIAWWPGRIRPGTTCDAITSNIDLLPTFVSLAGGEIPHDNKIDGKDLSPLLLGHTNETPHEALYYYSTYKLEAVRVGPWKLVIAPQMERLRAGDLPIPASMEKPRLYNLDTDIGEVNDVASSHPDIVERLRPLAVKMASELGTNGKPGPEVRPPGLVENPTCPFELKPGTTLRKRSWK